MFTPPGHRRVTIGYRLASHFPNVPDAGRWTPPRGSNCGAEETRKCLLKYEKMLNHAFLHLAIPVYVHPVGGLFSCESCLRPSCWRIKFLRFLLTPFLLEDSFFAIAVYAHRVG